MEGATSKVIVEYHDPFGIFPLISEQLSRRFPLQNLEWQSPTRPLRQIRALDVELVPDTSAVDAADTIETGAKASVDIVRSGQNPTYSKGRKQRHQIPGLKTSPYLKIYLLRCDDKDQYKEVAQQFLRDWVADNGLKDTSIRHGHDAFEWLILHVVFPGTAAANEPRWRGSSHDSDDLRERPNSAKLPGRSKGTVFDRLRADFNSSSKIAPDRVAQIRLLREDVPDVLLAPPDGTIFVDETVSERNNAWADLIAKIKLLILGPLDARVRQYEVDITVQESRRSLPGWNFCTFFIHKEGLANALESVGLAEDALAIYDELALGLETVCRESAFAPNTAAATTFARFTEESANSLVRAEQSSALQAVLNERRQRIARSEISLFDLHQYVFAKQKILILRLARPTNYALANSQKPAEEDIAYLTRLCERACLFVQSSSRILRQELLAAAEGEQRSELDQDVIDVWVWEFTSALLNETTGDVGLAVTPATGSAQTHTRRRTTSAVHARLESRAGNTMTSFSEQLDLARYRAELFKLEERALQSIARRNKWLKEDLAPRIRSGLVDIPLDGGDYEETVGNGKEDHRKTSVFKSSSTFPDEASFLGEYEGVCQQILLLCELTKQRRTASEVAVRLAEVLLRQDRAAVAVEHIEQILRSEENHVQSAVLLRARTLYTTCLSLLNRNEELAHAALNVLRDCAQARIKRHHTPTSSLDSHGLPCPIDRVCVEQELLDSLARVSRPLSMPITVRLLDFFASIKPSTYVKHVGDCPTYTLDLALDHVLDGEFTPDDIRVTLISTTDTRRVVHFSWNHEKPELRKSLGPGHHVLVLRSSQLTYGLFYMARVEIKLGDISFSHDFAEQANNSVTKLKSKVVDSAPLVFLYSINSDPGVDIGLDRMLVCNAKRSVLITFRSGRHELHGAVIRVRPASAELRLHLADATSTDHELVCEENTIHVSGVSSRTPLSAKTSVSFSVPFDFSTRRSDTSISIRVEVQCVTELGEFTIVEHAQLSTALPLDVVVDDIFRTNSLTARFTVRSANRVPYIVSDATLANSAGFSVCAPKARQTPVLLTHDNTVRLAYRIERSHSGRSNGSNKEPPSLKVSYIALDEAFLSLVQTSIITALQGSALEYMQPFILSVLVQRFPHLYNSDEIVDAAMRQELSIKSFKLFAWEDILQTLESTLRITLLQWLRKWHKTNMVLRLNRQVLASIPSSIIMLPVDIPMPDLVFDVWFEPLRDATNDTACENVSWLVGQAIPAIVKVRQTDVWSSASLYGDEVNVESAREPWRFSLDIQADPEVWIVSCSGSLDFQSKNGTSSLEFEVSMTCLKPGQHLLPAVNVQCLEDKDEAPSQSVNMLSINSTLHVTDEN